MRTLTRPFTLVITAVKNTKQVMRQSEDHKEQVGEDWLLERGLIRKAFLRREHCPET